MAAGDSLLVQMDSTLNDIFAGWSFSTTLLATILVLFIAYPWLTWKDPDTHPFLLARQATVSPVRQPGKSAIYRSPEIPYGYPLRSGLNIKDPGAPKWGAGRNGDLRDIWIQAARGPVKDDGSVSIAKSKFLTVLGREKVEKRSAEGVNPEITVIGQYLQKSGSKRVAICLSNSVEFLASLFAASFYGIHPMLVPIGSSADDLIKHLQTIEADTLIAGAGSFGLEPLLKECPRLTTIICVTKAGNQHMNFSESAAGLKNKAEVSIWNDLIEEHKSPDSSNLPAVEHGSPGPSLTVVTPSGDAEEVIEYASENIVAAVAALINVLPRHQRINADDVVLPTAPLTSIYPLTLTLASLFSNATIALNSVAGENNDISLSASGIEPTILIASSQSATRYHDKLSKSPQGLLSKLSHYWQTQSLVNGNMSKTPSFTAPGGRSFANKLRLLFIYRDAASRSMARLSTAALADLKIALGARTCYTLTAPRVTGAVAQTNIFDYRPFPGPESHFGPPLSSAEVILQGDEENLGGLRPQGKIVVRGPAVVGGEVELGVEGRIEEDTTLSLV